MDQDLYDELSLYTLTHSDPRFIHQYVVDAFAAQTASARTSPMALAFALVGLYLHVEKHVSGKDVQRVHSLLARRRRQWPLFDLPEERGAITVTAVVAAPPGPERDAMIDAWSASVWEAYRPQRDDVVALLDRQLG